MRLLTLALALFPTIAAATPQDGSYRNDKGAVLFVEHAGAEGFDFTLSSAATCPQGETNCMSVDGHAAAAAKGYAWIDPDDDRSRIFFRETGQGLSILSTTGDLGTGTANHAVLLVLPGLYAAEGQADNQTGGDQTGGDDEAMAEGIADFRSPTGNIGCEIINSDRYEVRCDLAQLNESFTTPPADCDLDWGDSFTVAEGDKRGALVCHGDTVMFPDAEVLDYGQSKTVGGITCTSEKTGMTCQNAEGHGFTVSRKGQSLF